MANFLTKTASGVLQLVSGLAISAGVADAGKIPQLNAAGKLDISLIPAGIGEESISGLTAGAALTAGQFVYIGSAGTVLVASNTSITTAAQGYVKANHANAATDVVVYFEGVNSAVTAATIGATYYLGTAGAIVATPPTFAVNTICQALGTATATNTLQVEIARAVQYAVQ